MSDVSRRCMELADKAIAAGWREETTRDGIKLLPLDRDVPPIYVHLSMSDPAVYTQMRSRMRQAGLDV